MYVLRTYQDLESITIRGPRASELGSDSELTGPGLII